MPRRPRQLQMHLKEPENGLERLFGWLKHCSFKGRALKLGKFTIGEVMNTEIDALTLIRLISAIKKFEEKLEVSLADWYRTPKEYEQIYREAKEKYYNSDEEDDVASLKFHQKLSEKNDFHVKIKFLMKDIFILVGNYKDDTTTERFIRDIGWKQTKIFYKFLYSTAVVFANSAGFPAPLYIFLTILFFPLHHFFINVDSSIYANVQKYFGTQPLPENLNEFRDPLPGRVLPQNNLATSTHASPISPEAAMLFCRLRRPNCPFDKEKVRYRMFNSQVNTVKMERDVYIKSYQAGIKLKKSAQFDLSKLADIRVLLNKLLEKSWENLESSDFPDSICKENMRKHVQYSFEECYENVSKWEMGFRILKKMFPRKATPISLEAWFEHHQIFDQNQDPCLISPLPNDSQSFTMPDASSSDLYVFSTALSTFHEDSTMESGFPSFQTFDDPPSPSLSEELFADALSIMNTENFALSAVASPENSCVTQKANEDDHIFEIDSAWSTTEPICPPDHVTTDSNFPTVQTAVLTRRHHFRTNKTHPQECCFYGCIGTHDPGCPIGSRQHSTSELVSSETELMECSDNLVFDRPDWLENDQMQN